MSAEQLESLKYLVGGLIIANIGTLATVWIASLKLAIKATAMYKDLQHNTQNAKDTAVRAHKRIDQIEGVSGEV